MYSSRPYIPVLKKYVAVAAKIKAEMIDKIIEAIKKGLYGSVS